MSLNRIISFSFQPDTKNNIRQFNTDLIGTSDCNTFIPFFSIFGSNILVFQNEPNDKPIKILEYSSLNIDASSGPAIRDYDLLLTAFVRTTYVKKCYFKVQSINYVLKVHRGVIYDDNKNILMCLAINSEYFLNTPIEEIEENPDVNQFILFITQEFNNPIYKKIRKRIDLKYLPNIRDLNIDIIETNKINHWLFKNNFKSPKFKNVIEMNKHLNEEIPMYLLSE